MISVKTVAAILLGILIAIGAHASGKPWWIDHPFMGDATDVGTTWAVVFRFLLGFFDREQRP